jgi:formamidopyrimidine-DNA glycosylase
MPELPEVEIVRRCLEDILLRPKGKTIKNIKVFYPNIIKDPAPNEFINKLIGQKFTRIDRYGKHLILKLQNYSIISHLRMEGKYLLKEPSFVPEKHDHIQFLLTDGTSLIYNDVRKFGTMHLVKIGEEYDHPSISKLGP